MQRRHFLDLSARGLAGAATLGAGLSASARLWAAPQPAVPDARLLLVFLRGGYDALSLLVPTERSFYDSVRPNIRIPLAVAAQGGQPALPGAVPISADWALHPALAASVLPLLQAGQASFVPFAGSHNLSRSHFETQDSIELGLAAGLDGAGTAGGRDFQTGFMNRLASQLHGRSAIAFTEQLPLVLRGRLEVANVSLRTPPRAGDAAALQAATQAMYQQHPLRARVAEAFEVRDQVVRQIAAERAVLTAAPAAAGGATTGAAGGMGGMGGAAAGSLPGDMAGASAMAPGAAASAGGAAREMAAAGRGAISARGFELEARRVARLMRERYALGFVDVGGWDTHVNQGAASGALANRFEELGRGLAGFADEIGPAAWRSSVVVVVSEFGRTVRENGNRGTDHGHGSVYWVLGGGLRGRPVAGEQQAVNAAGLFQDRDLPVLNDYRAVLGGLMARQFGLSPAALDQVFAGVAAADLGLL